MGFGIRWCGWVSILLSTASTSIMLNGARGPWFRHFRGLRQGDPLSPLLFILAMEQLQKLFDLATSYGTLSLIQHNAARLILVNTVPSAIRTFYLTVFALQKWTIQKIDKIR